MAFQQAASGWNAYLLYFIAVTLIRRAPRATISRWEKEVAAV
jgi:hypothetical protein